MAVEHVFSHPDVEQRTTGIPGDQRVIRYLSAAIKFVA